MIFDGTSEENGYVKSYWLASASMGLNYDGDAKFGIADVCGDSADSGCSEFSSNGWWIAYEFAVRPVITLKSGVTLENIKTIKNVTEEEWGGYLMDVGLEEGMVDCGSIIGDSETE